MERFDPEAALKAIDAHRVSYAQFVPTVHDKAEPGLWAIAQRFECDRPMRLRGDQNL
jgi:hypothetical protein